MGLEVDDDQRGGDAHLAVKLQEHRDRHPILVRDLAGRWEQGLRGLLGIVGASGLIGAPLAADQLSGPAQATIGVLLGVTLVTTAGGLALVMSAAYGSVRLHTEPTAPTERIVLRWALAESARTRLRYGRFLALAALALFAASVVVAWLDTGTDATPEVSVLTTTGVTHCGPLLDAPPGVLALATPTEGRVEIPTGELAAVRATDTCDRRGT